MNIYQQSWAKCLEKGIKWSKIWYDQKTLVSTFALFLTAIAKPWFVGGRLEASGCFWVFHPVVIFFEVLSHSGTHGKNHLRAFFYNVSISVLVVNNSCTKISNMMARILAKLSEVLNFLNKAKQVHYLEIY